MLNILYVDENSFDEVTINSLKKMSPKQMDDFNKKYLKRTIFDRSKNQTKTFIKKRNLSVNHFKLKGFFYSHYPMILINYDKS